MELLNGTLVCPCSHAMNNDDSLNIKNRGIWIEVRTTLVCPCSHEEYFSKFVSLPGSLNIMNRGTWTEVRTTLVSPCSHDMDDDDSLNIMNRGSWTEVLTL
ncbi:hypothetical protein AVEN_111735-1 [Araneus ventricosus]|uniref:Uncharacterized protein n=1 Tax=Araneus ventricosus TaxID=182803 RepID=A0A4Y2CA14_ARAVE|nr:hypothetical protein AVEN_111735-1 [Araneus ventricosus]